MDGAAANRGPVLPSTSNTTQAVMFADVSDSVRLYEKEGDAEALRLIGACLATMREVAENNDGRVVKTIGDELMLAFDDIGSAATAAIEMQTVISEEHDPLSIRIGFDFGPVIAEGNDLYGDTVNVASRMEQLAQPGQILATARALKLLPSYIEGKPRLLSGLSVKGKTQELEIGEIVWRYLDNLTTVGGSMDDEAEDTRPLPKLRLKHASGELVVEHEAEVRLGRAPDANVVITDPKASRDHAAIVRRRDKYVLIDRSSNGTFVYIEGRSEIRLKREEYILSGSGTLGFGQSPRAKGADTVIFICD